MASVSGLDGIVAAETEISLVDGDQGRLVYRGYEINDLATRDFEDVVFLLWNGRLPERLESLSFRERLAAERQLPGYVSRILESLPEGVTAMDAVRTAVSALGAGTLPSGRQAALSILAKIPAIIGTFAARGDEKKRSTFKRPDPPKDLTLAKWYLSLLGENRPDPAHVEALNAYLVLAAEHGMNASTFAARVTASTGSDLYSALCSAVGTLKGPLHGGAPSGVFDLLDEIRTPERAEEVLRDKLERGERLMGFGHRVYRVRDPRAAALQAIVERYAGSDPWFALARHVEATAVSLLREYKPNRPLNTNVEFYAAAVFRAIGLPQTLYTATFSLARTAGWCAHVLEQEENNRLIRPLSVYVGPFHAEQTTHSNGS